MPIPIKRYVNITSVAAGSGSKSSSITPTPPTQNVLNFFDGDQFNFLDGNPFNLYNS